MGVKVGVRELKARLSAYLRIVEEGGEVIITIRGRPVGRIVPFSASSPEERLKALAAAGMVSWSGRKLAPMAPVARTRGGRTVADLLLEDRG